MTSEVILNELHLSQLKSVAEHILLEAKRLGATQASVDISANKAMSVSARNGDVETVSYHADKSIDITVSIGKKTGSSSLSDVRLEAVNAAVAAACHIASFTDEDPAAGLPESGELAFQYPTLDIAYPWHINVKEAGELAIQCEREAVHYDKRIMSAEEVSVVSSHALCLQANSLGFMGFFPYTRHEISCVLVAKEKDEMERDYAYTVSVDPKKLESTSSIAKKAAERVIRRLGARSVPTCRVPVLFLAEEARSLWGHFASAIGGGAIYRRTSFLVDHLGKKIFPDFVHIEEQPHLSGALGSSPFDAEGVATRNNVFIDQGILQSYALSVYSARKLNLKTTGNAGGLHNLIIKSGDLDFSALLKKMGTGLLVTELMGQGVNLLTGDYSRGAGGFWVENGEIQFPVHEVTIAGQLPDMFANILAVGNDVDTRGNIRSGSVLLSEMTVAGG